MRIAHERLSPLPFSDANTPDQESLGWYRLGQVEGLAKQTAENLDKLEDIVSNLTETLPLVYVPRREHEAAAKEGFSIRTQRGLLFAAFLGPMIAFVNLTLYLLK